MLTMSLEVEKRVILVTGANKGIGFWVVKKLSQESPANSNVILLGSRDIRRGQDALIQLGSPPNVHLLLLDTSSSESITRAVAEVKDKYSGQVDVVINNAGISKSELTVEAAREVFATNFYGIKLLNEHLLPLIRENGRIINVSSGLAPMVLHQLSKRLQEKYTCPTLTKTELENLVEDFVKAIGDKSLNAIGYGAELPFTIYGISKAAVNALTIIEAREWAKEKNILVVSVTPGFCATDINQNASDARPAADGADSILFAVNSPRNEIENGGFYRDGKQLPLISEPIPRAQWHQTTRKKVETSTN